MDELTSFASIPAIIAICYLAAIAFRWAIADPDGEIRNKKALAFIPVLCGAIGMTLGIITYYQNPEVIHSDNVLAAATDSEKRLLVWQNHDMMKQLDKICAMWPRSMWPQNKRNAIY